jgi:hypothetical protein
MRIGLVAELAATDVETYTNGQLSAADPETQRMLDASLTAARRDVRWFVSPIETVTITLNGTGTPYLRLPTKQVINLTSITSDGNPIDPVADVTLDSESGNLLILNNGCWSSQYNGVTITMEHGFPEDTTAAAAIPGYTGSIADDWRQAILSLVTNIAQIAVVGRSDYELDSKQIDDVVYRWSANPALGSVEPILAKYRLLYLWV